MTAQGIYSRLSDLGVQLWVQDERLRFRAPKGVMTKELRAQLGEHKVELLKLLGGPERDGVARPAKRSSALQRVQFKLRRPGWRRGLEGRPGVQLPEAPDEGRKAFCALRRSHREFLSRPVQLAELDALLARLCPIEVPGEEGRLKYRYPSAGSLYPVQAYIQVKPGKIEGLEAGTYYHHPLRHRLIRLSGYAGERESAHAPFNRPVYRQSALTLHLVARYSAIAPLYARWTRAFCLLESGYMCQLLMSPCYDGGQSLGMCPLREIDFQSLRPQMQLEQDQELLLALLCGPVESPARLDAALRPAWSEALIPDGIDGLLPSAPAPSPPDHPSIADPLQAREFKDRRPGLRTVQGKPFVQLSRPEAISTLQRLYAARRSWRRFRKEPLALQDLSGLLDTLRPLRPLGSLLLKYRYPSSRGLYPVQTYLVVKPERVDGLAGGAYCYQPSEHRLVRLSNGGGSGDSSTLDLGPWSLDYSSLVKPSNLPLLEGSAFWILLVADWEATGSLFPDYGSPEALIEAGCMGQLLMTESHAHRIGLCAIGDFDLMPLRAPLGLGAQHQLAHVLVGGRVPRLDDLGAHSAHSGDDSVERAQSRSRAIRPVPRQGQLPLSFAQQRLWFLDRLTPGTPFYNIPSAWQIEGKLDLPALQLALSEIVRRHETLRTCFPAPDGQPQQRIVPPHPFPLPVVDLQGLSQRLRQAELQILTRREALRPFDLTQGPVIRATVVLIGREFAVRSSQFAGPEGWSPKSKAQSPSADFRSADSGLRPFSCLLLTLHHIAADGWSIPVFIRELSEISRAFCRRHPSALPELPLQYADFAAWQRGWMRGAVLEEHLDYWKRQLADVPVLELSGDRPRPAVQGFQGARLDVRYPAQLLGSLQALSRRHDATLFMTLLAAFAALLHRCTGQSDLAAGTPIANRNHPGIEKLIGFFVNTLVLRCRLGGDPPFDELIKRTRDTALQGYAHQDLPFEKLVEHLQPIRDLSRSPLFQVLFALQNNPKPPVKLQQTLVRELPSQVHTALFDFEVHLWESDPGLRGVWIYNRDLFDRTTMLRLHGQFRSILESAACTPHQRISELVFLSCAERRQLLDWSFNPSTEDSRQDCALHHLVERQSRLRPDAVAAVCCRQQISFGELDRLAEVLAQTLIERGLGAESLVGLCLKRNPETLWGLLGILKAGGVYLPLDPDLPRRRIEFLMGDAGVGIVIRAGTQAGAETGQLDLDEIVAGPDLIHPQKARPPSGGQALAYMIYTSGSTGKPKGVAVSHQAATSHFRALAELFRLGPSDRVSQFYSLSFDASLEQIFPALMAGACLVMPQGPLSPCGEFADRSAAGQLTVIDLPTAYWAELARDLKTEELFRPPLRVVAVGGEEMTPEGQALWQRAAQSACSAFHLYGATESVAGATALGCFAGRHFAAEGQWLPIGRPLPGRTAYILDSNFRLLPAGVAGGLFLGGILARGYQGHPALTAERFLPDPFSELAGARLYRSGDRARWHAEGQIVFLGRTDSQVKLRGFRIEPGEVEATLVEHPQIRQAAVVALDHRLVAYVVRKESGVGNQESGRAESRVRGSQSVIRGAEAEPESSAPGPFLPDSRLPTPDSSLSPPLPSFLRQRLPSYMVPSSFMWLEALPRTAGGKLDRSALPVGDSPLPAAPLPETVLPRSEAERRIAAVWQQVLQRSRIGVYDNFFDLGGHSLLMARVHGGLRKALGCELSMVELFQYPTIDSLARRLESAEQVVRSQVDLQAVKQRTGKRRRARQRRAEKKRFHAQAQRRSEERRE